MVVSVLNVQYIFPAVPAAPDFRYIEALLASNCKFPPTSNFAAGVWHVFPIPTFPEVSIVKCFTVETPETSYQVFVVSTS